MFGFESVKMLMGRSCEEGLMAEERGMTQSFLRRQEFLLLERSEGWNRREEDRIKFLGSGSTV